MSGPVFVLPVGSNITVGTGVTTYSGLLTTSTTKFLNRSDLSEQVPNFMALVEEEFNRKLRVLDMEETVDLAVTSGDNAVALPDDFLQAKEVHVTADPCRLVEQLTQPRLKAKWGCEQTGKPVDYAIVGGELHLGPIPDQNYTLRLTYWQAVPPLSLDNESNWISLNHPSAYLFGILFWAEFYGWNDERAVGIEERFFGVIDRIQRHGHKKSFGGPRRAVTDIVSGTPFNINTG